MNNTIPFKKKGKYKFFLAINLIIVSIALQLLSGCEKDWSSPAGTVADIEGNIYNLIKIGTQTWFGRNLETTKYNDGIVIPNVVDPDEWTYLTTDAYCYYDNSQGNKQTYGNLYNWYAVNTGKLCPTGWHVPSSEEWKVLEDFLGGSYNAGGRLKESGTIHWDEPNYGAINSSGFSALPAGFFGEEYINYLSIFDGMGFYAGFWSSTEADSLTAPTRYLSSEDHVMGSGVDMKYSGLSVRCLKDN
jgi:uncharacterized protein (TIGR02145 family)